MDSSTGAASPKEMRPFLMSLVNAAAVCSCASSIRSTSVMGFKRRQSCRPRKEEACSSKRAVILSYSNLVNVF